MNGIAVLLSLATIGVDFGWQPAPDGRLEYIIQLRPAETAALEGDGIVSEIPSEVQHVRRIRVLVGTAKLPQVGAAPTGFAAGADAALTQGGRTGLNAAGVLDLPPPPPLLGPDGKTSVLVRPGERALPGIAPANGAASPPPSTPSFDLGNPGVPAVAAPGGFSNGFGFGGVGAPAGGIAPPGNTGSGFSSPPAWGDGNSGGFSVPAQPVPGSGPESGFPTPIRGAQDNPKNQSLIEKMVAISKDPTGKHTEEEAAATGDGIDATLGKPALDVEEAERIKTRPWAALVWTSLALFGSLAANAYLGWVAVGIYGRYRDMCEELHEAQASLTSS
jgi:hypothetical protein